MSTTVLSVAPDHLSLKDSADIVLQVADNFVQIFPMEHTVVEDFQRFQGRHSSTLSNEFQSGSAAPQRDFPIHSIEHEDDVTSLSGSAHHSSGPDEVVFDSPFSHHSSPQTSHHSDDNESISSFFSGSRDPPCPPEQPSSPYTPLEMRSPFRNPSSVRAIQMETTPPPYISSSQSRHRTSFPTPARHATPKSVRSNHSGMRMSPSKLSPTKRTSMKKEYPLVLLHVTLLPIPEIYSAVVMNQVLPSYLLENWKILREKATDTVLERGILIPHPKDDYDLLEDRLLESLDLRIPRILKCGHFHLDPEEEADIAGSDWEDKDENEDADICDDCGRRVRDGRYGSGTGSRRWDIKVYAANGLMRAGAWGAAWREMERVDVEIIPWMDDEVKRELTVRTEAERKHAALLREETVVREDQRPNMDEERMREIYGDDIPAFTVPKAEQTPSSQPVQASRPRHDEVPLQDLLKNYLVAAIQDRKNIAILVLTIFVLYLSMAWKPSPTPPMVSSQPSSPSFTPSITVPAVVPRMSTSTRPSCEPSAAEPSETPTLLTSTQDDVEPTPSATPEYLSGDTADSIEARFEFSGE
ncbi:MAG: hypothetical protein Q9213_006760 [Squamulea squamosa]